MPESQSKTILRRTTRVLAVMGVSAVLASAAVLMTVPQASAAEGPQCPSLDSGAVELPGNEAGAVQIPPAATSSSPNVITVCYKVANQPRQVGVDPPAPFTTIQVSGNVTHVSWKYETCGGGGGSTGPDEPDETDGPGEPGEGEGPGETEGPTEPGETEGPGEPGETEGPGEPGETDAPGEPGEPGEGEGPGEPGEGEGPGDEGDAGAGNGQDTELPSECQPCPPAPGETGQAGPASPSPTTAPTETPDEAPADLCVVNGGLEAASSGASSPNSLVSSGWVLMGVGLLGAAVLLGAGLLVDGVRRRGARQH